MEHLVQMIIPGTLEPKIQPDLLSRFSIQYLQEAHEVLAEVLRI